MKKQALFQVLRESVNVTLVKNVPTKKRHARANQTLYKNKKIIKEIMKNLSLEAKIFKYKKLP